jgi:hypothetical protein
MKQNSEVKAAGKKPAKSNSQKDQSQPRSKGQPQQPMSAIAAALSQLQLKK